MSTAIQDRVQSVVPAGMEAYKQFINWKLVPDPHGGKADKVPCSVNGRKIDAHDPAVWISAEEAAASSFDIGFVFTENDPLFFIDLDHAYNNGVWSEAAQEAVNMFPHAAIEISHSGDGLHIFGSGRMGTHRKRRKGGVVELYTEGRFVALTGNQKRGAAVGVDYSIVLQQFALKHGLDADPEQTAAVVMPPDGPCAGCTMPENDTELLEIMRNSRGSIGHAMGEKASAWELYTGDMEALRKYFPQDSERGFDHSAADSALMMHLCFYTGFHRSRMQRLFEASALWRADKYGGSGAYRLQNLYDYSFSNCKAFYNKARTPMPAPALVQLMPEPINVLDLVSVAAPAREWTVEGWIPHKQVTLFYADGGVGKTTMLLQLALAASSGRLWFGKEVKRRRVLYVSGEDEKDELHFRLREIMASMMTTPGDMLLLALESMDDPSIVKVDATGTLKRQALFEHIVAIIRANGIGLAILDPVADLFDGDEIDRRQVRSFISMLRRVAIETGCTVMLAAHPSIEGMKSKRGSSGSTAWNNSVRSRLYVTMGNGKTDEDNNEATDYRTIKLVKTNRGRTGEKIIVKWCAGSFSVPGKNDIETNISGLTAKEVFIDLLRWHNSYGISVNTKSSTSYAPRVFSEHRDSHGFNKLSFKHAMQELLSENKIEIVRAGSKNHPTVDLWVKEMNPPFELARPKNASS